MYVYYFSTSVSALSLLGMAYQILVVCMYVCMYVCLDSVELLMTLEEAEFKCRLMIA